MQTQQQLDLVTRFYDAWVRRDWDTVRNSLTDDFHFRSPVDDFHGIETYHTRCWPTGEGSKRFSVDKYMERGQEAFLLYTWEAERGTIRAAEYVEFRGDKICSIDCFWGFLPKS